MSKIRTMLVICTLPLIALIAGTVDAQTRSVDDPLPKTYEITETVRRDCIWVRIGPSYYECIEITW